MVLKKGVRALTIESGWPRAPRDGVVRGNGLACANIKHLGRPRLNVELLLISSAKGSPRWLIVTDDEQSSLTEAELQRHVAMFAKS